MNYRLTKPIAFDGKPIESITLDLDKLTGADMEFCARQSAAERLSTALVIDVAFQAHVAARASDLPIEALRQLGATDYLGVVTLVQGFLTNSV